MTRTALDERDSAISTVLSVLPSETTMISYEGTSCSRSSSRSTTACRPEAALWQGRTADNSSEGDGGDLLPAVVEERDEDDLDCDSCGSDHVRARADGDVEVDKDAHNRQA